ncbi:MAG: DMT family transporter [bacterium]|nr:DMT family transporter [bacterium]
MKFKRKHIGPFFLAVVASAILGTNGVAAKYATQSFHPITYLGIRYLIVGILLGIFMIKGLPNIPKTLPKLHLLLNIALNFSYASLFFIGISKSSALKAAVLMLTVPIFVYILSLLVLREKFDKRAFIGVAVGLVGSLLVIGAPTLAGEAISAGDLYLLGGYFSLATLIIHSKFINRWLNPKVYITYRTAVIGFVVVAGSLYLGEFPPLGDVTYQAWLAVAYGGVISGAIALILFYKSLRFIPAEQAATTFYADPLAGVVASTILLGDTITTETWIGAAIVILGIIIAHPIHNRLFHNIVMAGEGVVTTTEKAFKQLFR